MRLKKNEIIQPGSLDVDERSFPWERFLLMGVLGILFFGLLVFTWGVYNDKFRSRSDVQCPSIPDCVCNCTPIPDCVCNFPEIPSCPPCPSCPNVSVSPIINVYVNQTNSTE